jgi:hypothetical protein
MSFAEERKWEKLVPFIFGKLSIVATKTLATVLTDSAILLSASDTNETDLLAISKDGNLISEKRFVGFFMLVQPTQKDGLIQLFGTDSASGAPTRREILLTLDNKLEQIRSEKSELANIFAPRVTFRLRDASLISFGTAFIPRVNVIEAKRWL